MSLFRDAVADLLSEVELVVATPVPGPSHQALV